LHGSVFSSDKICFYEQQNNWEFFGISFFPSSVNLTNFAIIFAKKNCQLFDITNLEKEKKNTDGTWRLSNGKSDK
jgi:hypothetical protein